MVNMQPVLPYSEDLGVQRAEGDLLECGWPASALALRLKNLLFRSEDMSDLCFPRCIVQWFPES